MAKKIQVRIKSSTFQYIYDGVAYKSGDTLMIDASLFNSHRMELVEPPKEVEEPKPKQEETVEVTEEQPPIEASFDLTSTEPEEQPTKTRRRRKKSTS